MGCLQQAYLNLGVWIRAEGRETTVMDAVVVEFRDLLALGKEGDWLGVILAFHQHRSGYSVMVCFVNPLEISPGHINLNCLGFIGRIGTEKVPFYEETAFPHEACNPPF